ncbi:hypothetical protein QTP86_012283 [Hemibagrus guttatus]|nr:hypothetical protein QTP86_012283 [Hemibagrus guttatus]
MAFRSVQVTLTSLLFLLCLNLLTDKKTAAVNIREKCTCIAVAKSVLLRRITDFKIIDSAPLCDKVQIMIKFNERKKKSCLKSGKAKQRPKKPKAT